MPDAQDDQIPDPRGEDRDLTRALDASRRRAETGGASLSGERAALEVALLEGQIKANREHGDPGWRNGGGRPPESPGAYHRTLGQYIAAALGAVIAVGFTVYLVAGVLGSLVYGVALSLKIVGIIPS